MSPHTFHTEFLKAQWARMREAETAWPPAFIDAALEMIVQRYGDDEPRIARAVDGFVMGAEQERVSALSGVGVPRGETPQ